MKKNAVTELFLCSGLQSGGTSLVSWCFLQRMDMDGVYDMENSVIQTDLSRVSASHAWVKMTVGSFRTCEVADIYRDLGYMVKPVLVVRDVRYAFSSLIGKKYGVNGNTAEDPPVRMRFRRFLDDWLLFRERNWPVIAYENMIKEPEAELRALTAALGLQWDSGMLSWPKPPEAISYMGTGNRTFLASRQGRNGLLDTLIPDKANRLVDPLPRGELEWLDATFAEYNAANGYPAKLKEAPTSNTDFQPPRFEATSRKMLYKSYGEAAAKLERIRKHVIFGPLIKCWSILVNRGYRNF